MLLQDYALDTLTSPNINKLNFKYGPMRVYPLGYQRDIAGCIRNGRITINFDPNYRYAASYEPDAPRGQKHALTVGPDYVENRSGIIQLKSLSVHENALFRGTIIHECTHALQDWQRIHLSPAMSEGVAYVAGAIAKRLWGYNNHISNPHISAHAYALSLADRFLSAPINSRYIIPENDVQTLSRLVTTGTSSRYIFNGI